MSKRSSTTTSRVGASDSGINSTSRVWPLRFHRAAAAHDKRSQPHEPICVALDAPQRSVLGLEKGPYCLAKLSSHLPLLACVCECAITLLLSIDWRQTKENKPLAHSPHNRVVAVYRGSASRDQADLAAPLEGPTAVRADVTSPRAVVHLPERRQHLRPSFALHRQDRPKILGENDAGWPDRVEQPSGRVLGALAPR
jgi:hypothetical protein